MSATLVLRRSGHTDEDLVDVDVELELSLVELDVETRDRLEDWLRADLELAADVARARARAAAVEAEHRAA